MAIAPDGRTALSGGEDQTLKLWDLASGKELRTFTGHSGCGAQHRHCPGRPNRALGELGQDAEALGPGQRERAAHPHRALRPVMQRRHCPGRPNCALGESGQDAQDSGTWPAEKSCASSPGTPIGYSAWPSRPDGRTALSGRRDKHPEALGPGQRERTAHFHRALRLT